MQVGRPDLERLSSDEFARWWRETGEHELRQLLYWKWDPLGINDAFPNTADEYDGYAPQIVQALRSGADEEQLAHLLRGMERDQMGLAGGAAGALKDLISTLTLWFDQSQSSWRDFGPVRR